MKTKILVTLVAGFLPMSLWAAPPHVFYETGFEASGERFGNFPPGDDAANGWVFNKNRVTNRVAAPGGSQSLHMSRAVAVRPLAPDGGTLFNTNISLVSFDWFAPGVLSNHSIVEIRGLGVEMIFRPDGRMELVGTNGVYQKLGLRDVCWTSNQWHHVELRFENPGQNNLTTLSISTDGVQIFSGSVSPSSGVPFGRLTAPDPTDVQILIHGSGGAGDGGGAYFDNFRLEAIPKPAALPAAGAMIFVLGWIRRGKAVPGRSLPFPRGGLGRGLWTPRTAMEETPS
ncbi:MAG: hypothetical protein ACOYMV_05310 [Verrucomicrobiia bacterium]